MGYKASSTVQFPQGKSIFFRPDATKSLKSGTKMMRDYLLRSGHTIYNVPAIGMDIIDSMKEGLYTRISTR
jgi:hypothetical protein